MSRLSMSPGHVDFETESLSEAPSRLRQMPLGRIAIAVIAAAVLVKWCWPEFAIRHAEGVLVPEQPWQGPSSVAEPWMHDGYTLTSLAEIALEARVLHTKRYMIGRESDLSRFDLALGWGVMSDQWLVDQLEFSQSRRWYFYKFAHPPPVAPSVMHEHSGNFHIIAASDEVLDAIADLRPGHVIYLRGQLVKVVSPDGWYWVSSTSRTDRGDGSCELVWVEEVQIVAP